MTPQQRYTQIESFLTLLFAISVFIWKPGMYVSSGLITLYLLVRSGVDRDYRPMVWGNAVTKISAALFVLGVITASIAAENIGDVAWMARKTLFLPVVVFFLFALRHQLSRTLAMTGLIVSFWIASLLTLHAYNWQMSFGGRMQGPWPQGTWDTLMGFFFVFMVLSFKWADRPNWQRVIHAATTLMALLMLVLAGGRAPWMGALLSIALYFLICVRDKRVWTAAIGSMVVAAIMATTVFENKTGAVVDRLASVFNTTTEGSNWVRLQLWQIGIAQLTSLSTNDPIELLFGGGAESYDPKQAEFFKTMPFDEADRARLKDYGYPSGDAHNTYIDNALRHGVIWTLAMTLYLIWICTGLNLNHIQSNPRPFIQLVNMLWVGIFYTVFPHFVTLFFALFIAMLQNPPPALKRNLSAHISKVSP